MFENNGGALEADRRQHRRHSVRGNGFEIFSRKNQIFGKLENISETGLAFHYTPVKGEKAKSDTIDIMATGSARFYLSGVVCRRIYDISALDDDQTFSGTETRLCGLEFISFDNPHLLAFFLNNYINMSSEELHSP